MDKKEKRTLIILQRWVNGEITTIQTDRELEIAGVKLPPKKEDKNGLSGMD